mmetsp:Transcript_9492/g.19307  ORF Transcript_9492/g.19307 Transcript_9492/m.19307 type:complete len:241 (+) Transcript_9492:1868-2590(+)
MKDLKHLALVAPIPSIRPRLRSAGGPILLLNSFVDEIVVAKVNVVLCVLYLSAYILIGDETFSRQSDDRAATNGTIIRTNIRNIQSELVLLGSGRPALAVGQNSNVPDCSRFVIKDCAIKECIVGEVASARTRPNESLDSLALVEEPPHIFIVVVVSREEFRFEACAPYLQNLARHTPRNGYVINHGSSTLGQSNCIVERSAGAQREVISITEIGAYEEASFVNKRATAKFFALIAVHRN